jgi:hypothetical protein
VDDYFSKADWSAISYCAGYPAIKCPEHPHAWSTGWIHVHRLVAERKVGRLLTEFEVVHHINGVKDDFTESNIEVMQDNRAHRKEHAKTSKRSSVVVKCAFCNFSFEREKRQTAEAKGQKENYCNKECYWQSLKL